MILKLLFRAISMILFRKDFQDWIVGLITRYKKPKGGDKENIQTPPEKPQPEPIIEPKKMEWWEIENPSEDYRADYPLSLKLELILLAKRICMNKGLTDVETRMLLATIYGESNWNPYCVNRGNKDGSVDYGLCQFNDGPKVGKKWWIGEGAPFASVEEVMKNPIKCIEVMASGWHKESWRNNWYAYRNGSYENHMYKV